MIIENHRDVLSEGIGDTYKFGIDEEDLSHVFSVLRSQLYSDKPLSVLREYYTNGTEAHFIAGIADTPITIHLPTHIDPNLNIRDFGEGLSPEEIRNVYTKFGKSTKRKSNDFMGCLGFGSKAGFAYGSTFSVISHYQGKRTSYEMFLDENNNSTVAVLGSGPTTTHGIEVIIPVRSNDVDMFKKTAEEFFLFTSPRPTFTGNKPVFPVSKPVMEGTLNSSFDWSIYGAGIFRQPLIKMGQICYKIDTTKLKPEFSRFFGRAVLVECPIGAVSHTPSRESLEYVPKTIAFLEATFKEIQESADNLYIKTLKSKTTRWEAYRFKSMLTKSFYNLLGDIALSQTWRGMHINERFNLAELKKIESLGGTLLEITVSRNDKVKTSGTNPEYISWSNQGSKPILIKEEVKNASARIETLNLNQSSAHMALKVNSGTDLTALLAMPELSGFPWIDISEIELPKITSARKLSTLVKEDVLVYNPNAHTIWTPEPMPEGKHVYIVTSGRGLGDNSEGDVSWPANGMWLRDNWGSISGLLNKNFVYGVPQSRVPEGWTHLKEFVKEKLVSQFLEWSITGKLDVATQNMLSYTPANVTVEGPLKVYQDRVKEITKTFQILVTADRLNIDLGLPLSTRMPFEEHGKYIKKLYPGLDALLRWHSPVPELNLFVSYCQEAHKSLKLDIKEI